MRGTLAHTMLCGSVMESTAGVGRFRVPGRVACPCMHRTSVQEARANAFSTAVLPLQLYGTFTEHLAIQPSRLTCRNGMVRLLHWSRRIATRVGTGLRLASKIDTSEQLQANNMLAVCGWLTCWNGMVLLLHLSGRIAMRVGTGLPSANAAECFGTTQLSSCRPTTCWLSVVG